MKIVIIGDGKVGYKLAQELSEEGDDVVLIDNNDEKLEGAVEHLDIMCVIGEGGNLEVQNEAGVPDSDLVIACTSMDEYNMLSCLIARRNGTKHTIARVRNPIYYNQIDLLRKDLQLSMAVNPEMIVAEEISRLILYPNASKVETFARSGVELVEFPVLENSRLAGHKISEIYTQHQAQMLVAAIENGNDVSIPTGDYVLHNGDKMYLVATSGQISKFMQAIGSRRSKIKRVLIGGGGRISFYLALHLCDIGRQVKIIENDPKRCEELCELLPKATVINGDATDEDLLFEEGIHETDAFVALTGMDEENIIMSLFAQTQQVPKVILKVDEERRASMIEQFGLDTVVSQKSATTDVILSYVRARKKSQSSANVEAIYQFVNGRVEALEFLIKEESYYTNMPLKNLSIKKNNLIACISRRENRIIPHGEDELQVGDMVIIITLDKSVQDIEDILS